MKKYDTIYNCAIVNLINYGINVARSISQEEIDKLNGNSRMTKDYVQEIVKATKDIATWSFDEIVEFLSVNFMGTSGITKDRAFELVLRGVRSLEEISNLSMDEIMDELDCTEDELELLKEGIER